MVSSGGCIRKDFERDEEKLAELETIIVELRGDVWK